VLLSILTKPFFPFEVCESLSIGFQVRRALRIDMMKPCLYVGLELGGEEVRGSNGKGPGELGEKDT
jgi:hypothetical protein